MNTQLPSGLAIGVDIGGTKIAAGLVDAAGTVLRSLRAPTPAGNSGALELEVDRLVRELDAEDAPVGVAAAGFIDATQSEVYYAPNINWRNVPLRGNLEKLLGRPVTVDNDANAAGWAEYRFGAGRGVRHLAVLTLGTGVGGAIVTDGQLLRGGFGAAAELGHLRVVPDGLLCGCGQRGCLEQYGSGRSLMRSLNETADQGGIGLNLAEVRDRDGELTAENVAPLIREGDRGAQHAVELLGRALGAACASLAAVLDPERFVFGGGVAVVGETLLDAIRAGFVEAMSARGYHPEPTFAIAELANDAGLVGAADLARLYLQSHTAPQ